MKQLSPAKRQKMLDKIKNEKQTKEAARRKCRSNEGGSAKNATNDVVALENNTSITVMSELLSEHEEFDSFDDFKQKLDAYCTENHVQLRIAKSKSVQSTNRNMSENSKQYDDKFVYSNIQYTCKYGQKSRSTSAGKRPNQRYQKTFFINIVTDCILKNVILCLIWRSNDLITIQ